MKEKRVWLRSERRGGGTSCRTLGVDLAFPQGEVESHGNGMSGGVALS